MPPRSSLLAARKHPTQDRSRATVDAILEATAQLLGDEPPEALTVARIAERAGVSVGTLYQYFPNKDALFTRLTMDFHESVRERLREVVEAERSAEVEDVVRSVLAEVLALYRASGKLALRLEALGLAQHVPGGRAPLESITQLAVEALAARPGAAVHAATPLAAFVAVRAADGVLLGIAKDAPDLFDAPELGELLEGVVLGALAPHRFRRERTG